MTRKAVRGVRVHCQTANPPPRAWLQLWARLLAMPSCPAGREQARGRLPKPTSSGDGEV